MLNVHILWCFVTETVKLYCSDAVLLIEIACFYCYLYCLLSPWSWTTEDKTVFQTCKDYISLISVDAVAWFKLFLYILTSLMFSQKLSLQCIYWITSWLRTFQTKPNWVCCIGVQNHCISHGITLVGAFWVNFRKMSEFGMSEFPQQHLLLKDSLVWCFYFTLENHFIVIVLSD